MAAGPEAIPRLLPTHAQVSPSPQPAWPAHPKRPPAVRSEISNDLQAPRAPPASSACYFASPAHPAALQHLPPTLFLE